MPVDKRNSAPRTYEFSVTSFPDKPYCDLSKKTDWTKTYHAREGIVEYIDDMGATA